MLLPLGGQVQLLSCPVEREKKKNVLRLKLNLENRHSIKFIHLQIVFAQVMFSPSMVTNQELIDFKCLAWHFLRVCCKAFRNPTVT